VRFAYPGYDGKIGKVSKIKMGSSFRWNDGVWFRRIGFNQRNGTPP